MLFSHPSPSAPVSHHLSPSFLLCVTVLLGPNSNLFIATPGLASPEMEGQMVDNRELKLK